MKKLSIVLLALLATAVNAQTITPEAVKVSNNVVYINGNKCSSVQTMYIEHFKASKEEIAQYKSGVNTGFAIDENGLAFTVETVAPGVFGFGSDAQAEIARTALKDGATLKFDSKTSTCSLIVNDMKGAK